MKKTLVRRFWIVPPIILAVVLWIVLPRLKNPPQRVAATERAVSVRTLEVPSLNMVPRAIGYGTTAAAKTWEAVAEVAGQIAWISQDLKGGSLVTKGTELLRIDDSSYVLTLTQVETQLNALKVKDKTIRASLRLEDRSLSLLQTDLERKRKLRQEGTLSDTAYEEAERGLLRGEQLVQNLKNSLALNQAERDVLSTQKASAQLDLDRTHFVAPFDVRVTERKVHRAQYANKGEFLFSADGLAAVEIEARFPIGKLRPLIKSKNPTVNKDGLPTSERQAGALGLDALVRLRTATHTVEWVARVDRVAGLVDPETQSIGVVVVVDKPYEKAQPGERPPLVRNTFVEVELRKKLKGKSLVIPSSAIRRGKVYVVNSENRLEIRPVKIRFMEGGAAVISDGLDMGEILVLSDLVPAAKGMLLNPVPDNKALKLLKAQAMSPQRRKR